MKLYHGSSTAIDKPDVTFNTGFSDLGQGFYLTDDPDVARARAQSRARVDGVPTGVVSVFEFNESAMEWVSRGANAPLPAPGDAPDPFGLRFESDFEGIVAWANYIKTCRKGRTAVPGLGEPAIVRAWIANDDIEMICSGFAPAEALAEFID
ncbi:MAG: DUF3990 domain-containing protein, partial [Eggerthellaceae bacterium]|nr:DUF3990 domain-containing protein [Eggerthellaceae bacterium]